MSKPIGSDPLGRLSDDTKSGLATFRIALDDYIAARVGGNVERESDEEIARRLEVTQRRLDAAFFIAATASVAERGER